MNAITAPYNRAVAWASSPLAESIALLFVRIALAGIFWRSARTKVIEGTWIMLSDSASELFQTEYSAVPLPPSIASHLALGAETVLPILLVLGLFTRLSALGLFGMTMVIQIFVYPEAWWQVHIVWVAMAFVLIVRGGGIVSLDHLLARKK
jgi:putative oxidoreductase